MIDESTPNSRKGRPVGPCQPNGYLPSSSQFITRSSVLRPKPRAMSLDRKRKSPCGDWGAPGDRRLDYRHGTGGCRTTTMAGSPDGIDGGAAMTVMNIAKFERFFRLAAGLDVDKEDLRRY